MDRFPNKFLHASGIFERKHALARSSFHHELNSGEHSEFRQFVFHSIVGPNRQPFGVGSRFRAGWEDDRSGNLDHAARIMIDNWLLFGLEELSGGRSVFLDCTCDTLMGGTLWLLPQRWAIFKILESVEPSAEVLTACRALKAAGYRFALGDFASPETMHEFLDLADFIEVDFRHAGRRKRACMLSRLNLTSATLVATNLESEEEFQKAREEGFGLFEGFVFGERISFVKKGDSLDPMHCTRMLEALHTPGPALKELAELIDLESGIQCRMLRRANWVTPAEMAINSTRDAVEVLETADMRRMITLAMTSALPRSLARHPEPNQSLFSKNLAESLNPAMDSRARAFWWNGPEPEQAF